MPRFSSLLSLALGLLLSAAAVRADNWERFRGPNGDGISNDKNIPVKFSTKENVRWAVEIAGDYNGSPIVWGDRLFLQTAAADGLDRSLLCLDAKTGKVNWKRSIPGAKVKLSRKDTSYSSSTPTTDGTAVYIPFWNGKEIILVAYDFQGEKLWERNLGEFVSQHGPGASPIVYKDLLIFSLDKDAYREAIKKVGPVANPATLYALDKKTGKTVWEAPREAVRACYSVPFILEKPGQAPELIVTSTSAITSYQPLTGKSNWYWTWSFAKGPLRTIAATAHADGMLFACSGDGSGERLAVAVALNQKGNEVRPAQVWANNKQFPYVTCLLTKGEHLYFANDLGIAGCFHAKSGKEVWFERMPDTKFYASPLLIDGKIYACSEQGDVFVYAADTKYQLLQRNTLGEPMRATPAVADGALYIRTQNKLYCFGK